MEIHEAPDQQLYDKLKTGQGIFNEPLGITITTASSGTNPLNLETELYKYSKAISKGEIQDDSFYYAIFEAEENCDIMDEEQWYKANPALGMFRKLEDLKNLALRAVQSPAREASFRRFFLNQHVSLEHEHAINMELWKKALIKIDYEEIKHLPSYCGLDLSASQDITAFVQVFHDVNEDRFIVYPHLFTPKGTIKEREERDKVPYELWARQGYINALGGNFINFDKLHDFIKSTGNVEQILYDRWGSAATQSALEDSFDLIGFGQGFRAMSPVIKEFENLLISSRIAIADNECFTWMASNVVAVLDDAGNIKYSKAKSKNKIDGIIAMIMGLHGAILALSEFNLGDSYDDDYFDNLYKNI